MDHFDPSLIPSVKAGDAEEINTPKRPKLLPKKLTFKDDDVNISDLSHILPWSQCVKVNQTNISSTFNVDDDINKKVSVWEGDITKLKVDAIVNAANEKLRELNKEE